MKFTSLLVCAVAGLTTVFAGENCPRDTIFSKLQSGLSLLLSSKNLITSTAPARWSDFDAPHPGAVINVRNEADVVASNGGNGWATTFHLGSNGVIINLAGLNQVTFDSARTQATIGGGANIKTTIDAAYAAGALVETGNCNCVGTLGAILGAGYGNLMGEYSFGVDNVLSIRVVTPDGQLRNVTAQSDPDLFWALRGAGPNFGIVTSATVKARKASAVDNQAWTGSLIYTEDQLEDVIQAIEDLPLTQEMVIFLYFLADSTTGSPVIVASPWMHRADETSGPAAYASLYAIGPVATDTAVVEYNQWNSGSDALCDRGEYKPGWGAGFQDMIPETWRAIWDAYVAFQQLPGAERSGVLMEKYNLSAARSFAPSSAAFPNRNVNINAFAIPWYDDSSLDAEAAKFGNKVRDLLRSTSGLPRNQTYVNFAHGDEPLAEVYGDSLARLKTLKKKYDPTNVFNQWFDIQ
ncbi:FAD binding domain-containing protein [Xylariaceae sp. FL1019]|nr:FAD binding domain-containing protein [Xylariaceae sp. FL1019]